MRRINWLAPLMVLATASVGTGAWAQQGGNGSFTGLKLSGDQPIQIESDQLEMRDAESLAIFTGNVSVVQGPTLLKSGRMKVYYVKGGSGGAAAPNSSTNIDRIEVDGKVYVKSNAQVATGDSGTFDMKSEVLTLSGKEVVLSEGNNVLKGCKLTVQMKSGQAKVDGCKSGRVIMTIDPKSTGQ